MLALREDNWVLVAAFADAAGWDEANCSILVPFLIVKVGFVESIADFSVPHSVWHWTFPPVPSTKMWPGSLRWRMPTIQMQSCSISSMQSTWMIWEVQNLSFLKHKLWLFFSASNIDWHVTCGFNLYLGRFRPYWALLHQLNSISTFGFTNFWRHFGLGRENFQSQRQSEDLAFIKYNKHVFFCLDLQVRRSWLLSQSNHGLPFLDLGQLRLATRGVLDLRQLYQLRSSVRKWQFLRWHRSYEQ